MMNEKQPNLFYFNGNYDDFITQTSSIKGLIVTAFYATWCPACTKLKDVIATIANENPKVIFYKIDIDQSGDIANHFFVDSVPHVKFFNRSQRDLEEVASITGVDPQLIQSKIRQLVM